MISESAARALVDLVLEAVPGVDAVYVYGSKASDQVHPGSDLDLALLLVPGAALGLMERLDLAGRLQQEAGCVVDLSVLDLGRGVVHAKEVVATGVPVYVRDSRALDHFEMSVFSRYARLNEDRRPVLEAYSVRASAGG